MKTQSNEAWFQKALAHLSIMFGECNSQRTSHSIDFFNLQTRLARFEASFEYAEKFHGDEQAHLSALRYQAALDCLEPQQCEQQCRHLLR